MLCAGLKDSLRRDFLPGIPDLCRALSSQILKTESFANELVLGWKNNSALLLLAPLPPAAVSIGKAPGAGAAADPIPAEMGYRVGEGLEASANPLHLFFLSVQWQLLDLPRQSG